LERPSFALLSWNAVYTSERPETTGLLARKATGDLELDVIAGLGVVNREWENWLKLWQIRRKYVLGVFLVSTENRDRGELVMMSPNGRCGFDVEAELGENGATKNLEDPLSQTLSASWPQLGDAHEPIALDFRFCTRPD